MYPDLLATPDSTSFCSLSIGILPIPRNARDACCAAAGSIRPAAGASRVAGPAGSGRSMISASASAVPSMACRTRETPPSLRFLGRKVYLAAIVVLIAMRHGATELRTRQLSEVVGVDRRTVVRWREWWRESFTATPFWQIARAAFMPPVDQDRLPATLIERFAGSGREQLVALPRFLTPSPEAMGTLDNGFPRSAEDARRPPSGPRSTLVAP